MFKTAALLAAIFAAACAAGAVAAQEPAVRDPMRPFGGAAAAGGAVVAARGPRFALTGVLISPSRRVAIVNGRPHLVGDTVAGAEIVAIEPHAIRVNDAGAELEIPLRTAAKRAQPVTQGDTVP